MHREAVAGLTRVTGATGSPARAGAAVRIADRIAALAATAASVRTG